jgi:hypothetical protein
MKCSEIEVIYNVGPQTCKNNFLRMSSRPLFDRLQLTTEVHRRQARLPALSRNTSQLTKPETEAQAQAEVQEAAAAAE